MLETLERLLSESSSVTTLDVLEALPVDSLRLDLDALAQAGQRWQQSLERQQGLTRELARERLDSPLLSRSKLPTANVHRRDLGLPTEHRRDDLNLQIWTPEQA